jgi:hypothetical protein
MDSGVIDVRLRAGKDGIAARSFTRVMNEFTVALEEIDRIVEPSRGARPTWAVVHTSWKSGQGAVVRLAPRLPKTRALYVPDPALPSRALWRGLKTLETRPEIPEAFSERIVERISSVREEVARKGSGLEAVSLLGELEASGHRSTVDVSETVGENARQAVEPASLAFGSVVGTLDIISARRQRKRVGLLIDHGPAITCSVNGLSEDEIFAAFDKRVIAEGVLRRNGRGQAVRMDVSRLEIVEPASSIRVADLWGALPASNSAETAVEFIRRQRG